MPVQLGNLEQWIDEIPLSKMTPMALLTQNEALAFAEEIRLAPNKETAWLLLRRKLEGLGFLHAKYAFSMARAELARPPDILTLGAFCDEFEVAFSGPFGPDNDAVVEHALKSDLPLTYRTLYAKAESGLLNPMQKKNHLTAREIGMKNGVAFALPDAAMLSRGGITLEALREEPLAEFEKRLAAQFPKLRLFCESFHGAIQKHMLLDPSRRPSPRETECLLWTCQGLRPQQIAYRLGTHPKTIDKQLQNVRRRLNARTNAQAAVRAVVLGLIQP